VSPHSVIDRHHPTIARSQHLKFYADGAVIDDFVRLHRDGGVEGFTTNPTLMRRAGISDYEKFSRELLTAIPDMPISLEVFSDEFDEMRRQALKIDSWGSNVYVKIPITNTRGESSLPLVSDLAKSGVKVNVTAILTLEKVAQTIAVLEDDVPAIVSIFAGRIADTGIDPVHTMRAAVAMSALKPKSEILWASTRETLNVHQARECGCHIITAPSDILKKLTLTGKDLDDLSRETVQMFYDDALSAGFKL